MYVLAREPARRTVDGRPLLGMSRKTRGVAAPGPLPSQRPPSVCATHRCARPPPRIRVRSCHDDRCHDPRRRTCPRSTSTSASCSPPRSERRGPAGRQVAIVTGGSNGLGTAIAARMTEEGATVAIVDIVFTSMVRRYADEAGLAETEARAVLDPLHSLGGTGEPDDVALGRRLPGLRAGEMGDRFGAGDRRGVHGAVAVRRPTRAAGPGVEMVLSVVGSRCWQRWFPSRPAGP